MSKLASVLKDVAPNKKVAVVLGALVADAASLPLEWIYKDDKMKVNQECTPLAWLESWWPQPLVFRTLNEKKIKQSKTFHQIFYE